MRRLAVSFLGSILAAALLAAVPALAQEEPPARVGRVSFVSGELGFHLAGETAWSAAKANYPAATGGAFWTDPKSRAELRIGSRTIDLSGNTELDITKLNEQVMQLALPQGRINLRVRTLLEGESIEIDLPRGAVWILQPGIYDIDAGAADQPERIAVFEGSARFVGGTLDVAINAGDAAVISGTQTLAAATERAAPDDFSKWCRSRDYDERRLAAPYHVSPQMTGYEELDEYGSWRAVPQYGEVWFPRRMAAGWAPYREGHWVWLDPWGWSWVDDEPWGFAPFHYGRWATVEDQWAWVPGEFVPQPVYAPALVAFVGDPGTGYWNAGDVGPAVGWFPLGPGEVYWPSYTRNRDYIRNINIANVGRAVIDPIASAAASRGTADPPPQVRDQRFTNRNATTVVPARIFANAAPVAPAAQQMPRPVVQQAAQQVPVSVRPPQLAPASARAQATPTGPRAPGARGTAQAPAPAISGAPGGAHAPGVPVAGPPINAAPGLARGPGGTPGGPGPHETAHAPPAAPGVANAPPPAAAARGPHAAPGVANAPPPPAAPGGAAPHEAAHAPPAAAPGSHPAPGLANAPPPAAARGSHPAPSVANAPPASPPAAAPQSARGPARMGPAQAAREPPPPTVHGPMRVGPPPQAAHAPPPAPHPAPPQMQQAPRMPPPQAVHAAPPPAPHPAPPPPQVVHAAPPAPPPHAAPAPPPQVFRPPPPPQAPHPAPPPQVAHAPAPPPPAAARPAGPPGPPPGKGGPPPKGKPPGPEEKH